MADFYEKPESYVEDQIFRYVFADDLTRLKRMDKKFLNPEYDVTTNGWSYLTIAAANGCNEVIPYLIEEWGFAPEGNGKSAKTPLEWAVERKHYKTAGYLFKQWGCAAPRDPALLESFRNNALKTRLLMLYVKYKLPIFN